MIKATYLVPFPDFDYVGLAKDCGITDATLDGFILIVKGTREDIDTLSNNLAFRPESE